VRSRHTTTRMGAHMLGLLKRRAGHRRRPANCRQVHCSAKTFSHALHVPLVGRALQGARLQRVEQRKQVVEHGGHARQQRAARRQVARAGLKLAVLQVRVPQDDVALRARRGGMRSAGRSQEAPACCSAAGELALLMPCRLLAVTAAPPVTAAAAALCAGVA